MATTEVEALSATPRTVLITGSARGIGESLVRRFASDGYNVAALDKDSSLGRESASRISTETRSRIEFYGCDVSDGEALLRAVEEASHDLGPITAGIANAGIQRDSRLVSMSDLEWHEVLNVVLSGAFYLTRALWRGMATNGGGSLVYIGSIASRGNFGQANYSSAKRGLSGLAATVAIEGGPHNIRANVVSPGVVDTPGLEAFKERAVEAYRRFVTSIPAGRIGTPGEVADLCAFLVSDRASYLSGQTIGLDGGLSAGGS